MDLCAVRIFVNDVADARSFYADILKLPLKVDDEPSGCCVFKTGAVDLVMESVPGNAAAEDRALIGRFTGVPERQAWGGALATFRDPAGNGLQLVERPAT